MSEWKDASEPPEMLGVGIPSRPVFAEMGEFGFPHHLGVVVYWKSSANKEGRWYLSNWFYGLDGPFREIPVTRWTELPLPPVETQLSMFETMEGVV